MKKLFTILFALLVGMTTYAANTVVFGYDFSKHLTDDGDGNEVWSLTAPTPSTLTAEEGAGSIAVNSDAAVTNDIASTWAMKLNGNGKYVKVTLGEALVAGQKIMVTFAANDATGYASVGVVIKATSDGDVLATSSLCSANKTFTEATITVPDALVGEKSFYVMRITDKNAVVSKIQVVTVGETASKVTWNAKDFTGWSGTAANTLKGSDGSAVWTVKNNSGSGDIIVENTTGAEYDGVTYTNATTWGSNQDGSKRYMTLTGIGGVGKLTIICGGKNTAGDAGKSNSSAVLSVNDGYAGTTLASVTTDNWKAVTTADIELDATKTYYLVGAFRSIAGIVWEKTPEAPASDVTISPASRAVAQNEAVTLTVSAAGNPLPTFQWYTCDDAGENRVAIDGATSKTYSPSTAEYGTYNFTCSAKNKLNDAEVFAPVATITVMQSHKDITTDDFVIAETDQFINSYVVSAPNLTITFGVDASNEWKTSNTATDETKGTDWKNSPLGGSDYKCCTQAQNTNPTVGSDNIPTQGGFYVFATKEVSGKYLNVCVLASTSKATFVTRKGADETAAVKYAYYNEGTQISSADDGKAISTNGGMSIISFPMDGATYYAYTNGSKLSFYGTFVSDSPATKAPAATAINNINADVKANQAGKVIKTQNGIIKDGKKYNYAGQQMK